jgi:D-3-phosphoglycerate dehydrogenase
VVGLGAVGRRVHGIFSALGSTVVGYDPFAKPGEIPLLSLPELLSVSDVVSLHAPPQENGEPLISVAQLDLLPQDAVLINTARAALVDDGAVLAALKRGRLSAYAVDAFDTEPPEVSELLKHARVIATPHIGGYTDGSVSRATSAAVDNLLLILEGP